MEQILAFVLGVSAVAFIWVVVVAFKTANKVKELEKVISGNQDWINQNNQLVNHRIDQEIDRVDQIYRECIRHTDSRVDKLDTKLQEKKNNQKLLKG
jgi:predicted RNase H-like nuclease (RuvC/YqgF family)